MAKALLDRIKLDSEYVDCVTKDNNWKANQWKCTIRFNGKQYTFDYFMGIGLSGKPDLKDVLFSLYMDAQAADMTFEQFCSEFGYDKAEATWKACVKAGKAFKRVFGDVQEQLDRILENY